jgi:hypothetical protein
MREISAMRERTCRVLFLLPLCLALLACPNPVSESILLKVHDFTAPVITIDSPAQGSSYAATVVVSGKVADTAAPGVTGRVKSLSFELVPATLQGASIPVQGDGSFSFQFETAGFSGQMVVKLTARDWNDNPGAASVTLFDAGAIPSFAATAANRSIILTWEDVPLAAGYSVYYTSNGTIPSEVYGTRISSVTSGFSVPAVVNGRMYTFLLRAHSTSGADNWSGITRCIPLSELDLAPKVKGAYGRILVEWPRVMATDEYELWRSTEREGIFSNISGTLRGTKFEDTFVDPGRPYFYRVSPSLPGSRLSAVNSGECLLLSPVRNRTIADVPLDAWVTAIAIQGSYAYLVTAGRLSICDVTNPEAPVLIGSCWTVGYAYSVCVVNNHAYISAGVDGVVIVDVSNKSSPHYTGQYVVTSQQVWDVATDGTYVYAVEFGPTPAAWGFRILNVSSNPENPTSVSFTRTNPTTAHNAMGITVSGSYAYLACGGSGAETQTEGLQVFNVSNPAAPALTGSCAVRGDPWRVAVSGSYACIAAGPAGVRVADISNPSNPVVCTSYVTPEEARAVSVSGSTVCVAVRFSGLHVVDISDPHGVGARHVQTIATTSCTEGVVCAGSRAFVADGRGGLKVCDLAAYHQVHEVGSYMHASRIYGVVTDERYAYLLGSSGLDIVDRSLPSNPTLVSSVTVTDARGIARSGDYLFIASPTGLLSVDVSSPKSPQPVGSLSSAWDAWSMVTWGASALVACRGEGVRIVDISDPAHPVAVSSVGSHSASYDIDASGGYAYIGDGSSMQVVDLADPAQPIVVGTSSSSCNAIAVSGEYAFSGPFFAARSIADPRSPGLLTGSSSTGGYAWDLVASLPLVFACDTVAGFVVYDVTQPLFAVPFDTLALSSTYNFLTVTGRYAFIAQENGRLTIIDLLE